MARPPVWLPAPGTSRLARADGMWEDDGKGRSRVVFDLPRTCQSSFLLFFILEKKESLEMVIVGRRGKPAQRVEPSRQVATVWLMVSLLNLISPALFKELNDMGSLLMKI